MQLVPCFSVVLCHQITTMHRLSCFHHNNSNLPLYFAGATLSTKVLTMEEETEFATSLIPDLYKPPALLPIAQLKDQLLYTIETHAVTIVVGETGSGKTTQIPKFLLSAGWCADGKQIAVTQVGIQAPKFQMAHHEKKQT